MSKKPPQKCPKKHCPNLGRQALINSLATFAAHSSMILLWYEPTKTIKIYSTLFRRVR